MTDNITKRLQSFSYTTPSLYGDIPGNAPSVGSIASKLGLSMPNLAPDIDEDIEHPPQVNPQPNVMFNMEKGPDEPKKKKYAKEAWPGKKPTHGHGLLL